MPEAPHSPIDPVALTQQLVRCPSVTPLEGGALVLLEGLLSDAGFACTRIDRGGVANLFARWGSRNAPTLGFNGHTDVVPVGDADAWTVDPFGAEIRDGFLYGRGATDMKSGVAAWVAAAIDFVADAPEDASLVITITGDEEGDATDGTTAILDWMASSGETIDDCIVGEPTSPETMGEMMKIGRRGSMTAFLSARGVQGHAAYPHRALNPVPALAQLITDLAGHELDKGTDHFDASTLAVTTFDTGNPATNVIPAECKATVNIRFNDAHTSGGLINWLNAEAARIGKATGVDIEITTKVSGESFVTPPGPLSDLVATAVEAEIGRRPEASTTGGTSDARFVKDICPVVEFGLVGKTMHEVDERVEVAQITQLKSIYSRIIRDYFA
ncbi:succinyl-diaminopimelate desuccinylase [Aliiroseovarius sp. S1339]|uniref:succinyl-diaminopimelate desuccinylase n=1 Tax=Aliiroseovarius sp. S1339 TaxID=2936990 RepID=UPI0020BE108B|nr:succinyl-diaminopimelate desuccinylase [Aliiroseovarius sp. S1339]MCK8464694.1 succinyl-diaminopimelate desuccinylase [Aliiroseovarius sp. S1339]